MTRKPHILESPQRTKNQASDCKFSPHQQLMEWLRALFGSQITNHRNFKNKSDERTVKENAKWEKMIQVLDE